MMVAAKLHNYVIEKDNLQFNKANSLEAFGVETLRNGPVNNHGYLPTLRNKTLVVIYRLQYTACRTRGKQHSRE